MQTGLSVRRCLPDSVHSLPFPIDVFYRKYLWKCIFKTYQANIYLFKVNNRNIRKRREIWWKLTIKIQERRQWRRSAVFIVNFEHTSHLFSVFLLLTLNIEMLAGNCRDTLGGTIGWEDGKIRIKSRLIVYKRLTWAFFKFLYISVWGRQGGFSNLQKLCKKGFSWKSSNFSSNLWILWFFIFE